LGGLESVAVGDRHPPRGDLARREVADVRISEARGGLAEQPPELFDRLGLGVVLVEIHLDQFGQSWRLGDALPLAQPLERPSEPLGGGALSREA